MRGQVWLALGIITLSSACAQQPPKSVAVDQRLTVWGSKKAVRNFVALQGSRRPALPTVLLDAKSGSKAMVLLPADFTGKELIHTTREALAAGLSYSYELRTETSVPKS